MNKIHVSEVILLQVDIVRFDFELNFGILIIPILSRKTYTSQLFLIVNQFVTKFRYQWTSYVMPNVTPVTANEPIQ